MKLNEPERRRLERHNSWQYTKHAKLYSGVLQTEFDNVGFPTKGSLLSVSAHPTFGGYYSVQSKTI